ncbi:hypothetical protein PGH12_01900 [Chryseobacterium wangxinyae]|uniref:hypothetical protein n=1 Tax=Chryseobacterium sp. CY350 TaxID=2997336 RepID=UPI00226EA403|nr:hypothetical protein [Chryseobacterium sp. CY350]MCY0979280.1 hypothetical protein [Chryseobacterium sp. CY350]WBZ95912.1 hypothetical protein PGH12_01900 [Chryseobacterium sp. CY350]
MENSSIKLCFALILISFTYQSVLIIIFDKKRKVLINDYETLLNLKDWYEKISEEASRLYIIESVDKRGNELIDQLNLLNSNLIEIQEQHKKLQEKQQKLHSNLLEEHKLLNQYFENYS